MIAIHVIILYYSTMSLYDNVQAARKKPETSRVGFRYSEEDDIDIMKQAADGVPVNLIAKAHKRTVRAMKERIAMIAVRSVIADKTKTLHEVSRMYHINPILLYRVYSEEKDKIKQTTNYIRDSCV